MDQYPLSGTLYDVYRRRLGEPTTHDEVRGYWVFLTGLVLGTLGILLFVPSTSASGTEAFSLRELSIVLAGVGLAMLVAGPVVRLPLQPWANYAAYIGQGICYVAAVWFLLVFPGDWSLQTGNQPVIVLYALGLAVITIGGAIAPLLVRGESHERQEAKPAEGHTAASRGDRRTSSSQARFELYQDKRDQWRWRLRHRNGNIIADSGQGYTRRANVQKGMRSVRRNAPEATTFEFEGENNLPQADAAFEPIEQVESQAMFELEEDRAGEFRWRLRHDNGNVLADSGEGYHSRHNANRSIDRIRELVGPADYLWPDPAAFEVYRDRAGEFRWRLIHANGNVLADSGEGYTRRNDATRSLERIRDGIDELEFEVYEDASSEFRWRLRGASGGILADSGEGYASRDGVDESVDRVRNRIQEAAVLEIGRAAFEIYEDRGGEHRWRLRHRNGNILMDSGEGYSTRSNVRAGIESVKRNAPNAGLTDQP